MSVNSGPGNWWERIAASFTVFLFWLLPGRPTRLLEPVALGSSRGFSSLTAGPGSRFPEAPQLESWGLLCAHCPQKHPTPARPPAGLCRECLCWWRLPQALSRGPAASTWNRAQGLEAPLSHRFHLSHPGLRAPSGTLAPQPKWHLTTSTKVRAPLTLLSVGGVVCFWG